MSKLEELIQKYCPDGVEWHPFFDVCDLIRGITYNKEQEAKTQTDDAHKVLRANNITLHLNVLNFEDVKLVSKDVVVKPAQHLFAGDILMCAGSGSKEHVGKVAFIPKNMDYTFGGFMAVVRCKEAILPRFVYHILTSGYFSNHLDVQINSSTINNINKQVMQTFELPVPPLPVQEEIVRVLDTFTELQAELQAELQKRELQYNYYQDLLLNKTQFPHLVTIGDLCDIKKGNTPIQKAKEGDYPLVVSTMERRSSDTFQFNANAVCIPLISSRGHGVASLNHVYYQEGKFALGNILCAVIPYDERVLKAKFLYYYLEYAKDYTLVPLMKGGANVSMHCSDIEKVKIPLPSFDEQERIVSILDKFDSLTRDLTAGLPAEIEKRKQQFEFYRDKLLTFKRKEA